MVLLGNAYFADNQFEKAVGAYPKSPRSESEVCLKARFNLGIVHTRKKNRTAAIEQYSRILAADANLAARLKAEIDKM